MDSAFHVCQTGLPFKKKKVIMHNVLNKHYAQGYEASSAKRYFEYGDRYGSQIGWPNSDLRLIERIFVEPHFHGLLFPRIPF